MKKILSLFVLISFAGIATAQKSEWLFGLTTKDSCKMLADDIMKSFKGKYKYASQIETEKNGAKYYSLIYNSDSLKNASAFNYEYAVTFQRFDAAAIKYFIKELKGNFSELFPAWLNYIDANADEGKIFKSMWEKKTIRHPAEEKKYVECSLRESNHSENIWQLRFVNNTYN